MYSAAEKNIIDTAHITDNGIKIIAISIWSNPERHGVRVHIKISINSVEHIIKSIVDYDDIRNSTQSGFFDMTFVYEQITKVARAKIAEAIIDLLFENKYQIAEKILNAI